MYALNDYVSKNNIGSGNMTVCVSGLDSVAVRSFRIRQEQGDDVLIGDIS